MVKKIALSNFRNFDSKVLEFGEGVTVIVGPNTSGKTNILESLYLLSTGKSFKATVMEEMIRYDKEVARIKGGVSHKKEEDVLEVVISRLEDKVKRKVFVNSVSKRLSDFGGIFKSVLFGPWHLDLVTESPSLRRSFLDDVLSQVEPEYRRALVSYEKGLRQRNRLLWRIREEGGSRSQLLFWNQLLIKNGNYLSQKRREFIEFVNKRPDLDGKEYELYYDPSAISEGRLAEYKEEEVAAATTLVGPHRDDAVFKVKKQKKQRELSKYGSRGEQRMGVLWVKLAELSYIKEKSEEMPTLLLDDIFSELDDKHREVVLNASKDQQTIITTADPHYLEKFEGVEKINL